jgi:MinD-like ATPase involved in chromosome partitioning or flagellar assembly
VSLPVLTAVTDAGWEAGLLSALERGAHGVTVIRRCLDVAELLSAAAAGTARAVVLSADLRRLDGDVVARLHGAGIAVLGLVDAGDEGAERRLRQLGVVHVLPADASPAAVTASLLAATSAPPTPATARDRPEPGTGRVVAVWGPTGAPGRTTVAVGVADEAARLGVPTLLVDADVYGGVLAQVLGLLDEAPGLAAAARLANQGALDVPALAQHARAIGDQLRVLTGITRADRWPELRPAAIAQILERARSLAALTVVDCGFCLEDDEELSYDTQAPRRNGATLTALEAADVVLAVGSADPIGVQRLVRGLADLRALLPGVAPRVVVNRLRPGVVPGDPQREVASALRRFAGVPRIDALPYDLASLDRALASGGTLGEAAPASALRAALAELASELAAVPLPATRRRRPR